MMTLIGPTSLRTVGNVFLAKHAPKQWITLHFRGAASTAIGGVWNDNKNRLLDPGRPETTTSGRAGSFFAVTVSKKYGTFVKKMNPGRLSQLDPSSFSNPEDAAVKHVDLDIEVDMKKKVLKGKVSLTVVKANPDVKQLVLDSRDLVIQGIYDVNGKALKFTLGKPVHSFGSKLEIDLPSDESDVVRVIVNYTTSASSPALQWLDPEQTAGKKHPFMFSQCQAILCRAMVPIQDSPGVKVTYSAKVTCPTELTVLMSALRVGSPQAISEGKRLFAFNQPVPIPPYLIAIVTGDLQGKEIGPRTHLWAEPSMLEKGAWEFAETDTMLTTAEKLCGPYVWGIYDLLLLPPSFPYGGMENPCLTFITPTLLAGDRSLVDVVAHEIIHSWTGNLVTNRNWEHFWLNEGFTVFLERKVTGRMHGEPQRHFSAIGGLKDLKYTIDTLGATNPLTCLNPNLTGVDPDDAFSTVPYEKGQTLLWYLEGLVGNKEEFEEFLRSYIDNFKYKSIEAKDFIDYLNKYFEGKPASDALKKVDWETWLRTPGMPPFIPEYDDTLAKACIELSQRWVAWNEQDCPDPAPFQGDDLANMTADQKATFLAQLLEEKPLSLKAVQSMEKIYDFDKIINMEIKLRWLRLGLLARWEEQVPKALEFATSVGRMKYVRPIFRDLYKWEDMRPKAIEAYEKHKNQWMYITAHSVATDLHLNE